MMTKLITAVVQPHRLESVKAALEAVGIRGLTVTEASGYGRQRGHVEVYRGAEYAVDLIPKVRIDVVVSEHELAGALEAVLGAAKSGRIGDGKIWVQTVDQVIRVRTGETGTEAL